MKKVDTIYYCGQGHIYRCPECQWADRMPWDYVPNVADCRFCKKTFGLVAVANMTPELYGVIRDINTAETGTPFGASKKMLRESSVAKTGHYVGIDFFPLGNQSGKVNKS
jgi:hypothetical protein